MRYGKSLPPLSRRPAPFDNSSNCRRQLLASKRLETPVGQSGRRAVVMSRTHSVQDITERYGVSEHTVLAWIRSGELRAINVGRCLGSKKPRWRITQEAVEAFEQLRTVPPPVPRTPRRKRPTEVIEFYK